MEEMEQVNKEATKAVTNEVAAGVSKETRRKEKQHAKGKLFATERLSLLYDDGDYRELTNPNSRDGVYVCIGKVFGQEVVSVTHDFTYKGGSFGIQQSRNIVKAQKLAIRKKCPYVMLNDSGGARIQEGIDGLAGLGNMFCNMVDASGYIPQYSVILGPCAGGIAYAAGLSDFVFMVQGIGQMYVTGPKVVKSVGLGSVTAEELGGVKLHSEVSGCAHFNYEDEATCFQELRRLISVVPPCSRSNVSIPAKENYVKQNEFSFQLPESDRQGYDIRALINDIMDDDSFIEIHSMFAQSVIVGFAKLYGITVGVIANQSICMAGTLDCDTSDKAARLVRFCDAFHIPVITLTDVTGFRPGLEQESKGVIRHGAKLLYAFAESTVPKVNVIVRKAYGGAYIAMNSRTMRADRVFAWPTAKAAVMGEQGAVEILYAKELKQMEKETREAFIAEKAEEYQKEVVGYKLGLEHGYIDELILPEQTRDKIYDVIVKSKRRSLIRIKKKHGNIPL